MKEKKSENKNGGNSTDQNTEAHVTNTLKSKSNNIVNRLVRLGTVICLFVLAIALLIFTTNIARVSNLVENVFGDILKARISSSPSPGITSNPTHSQPSTPTPQPTSQPSAENETDDFEKVKSMFEVYTQANTSALQSFLYTFFSTILVGTGMYFLTKTQESANETKGIIGNYENKLTVLDVQIAGLSQTTDDFQRRMVLSSDQISHINTKAEFISENLKKIETSYLALSKSIATMDSEIKTSNEQLKDETKRLDNARDSISVLEKILAIIDEKTMGYEKLLTQLSTTMKLEKEINEIKRNLAAAEYLSYVLELLCVMPVTDTQRQRVYSYIPKFRDRIQTTIRIFEALSQTDLDESVKQQFLMVIRPIYDRVIHFGELLPSVFDELLTKELTARCQLCVTRIEEL